jgi:hypothetical protein
MNCACGQLAEKCGLCKLCMEKQIPPGVYCYRGSELLENERDANGFPKLLKKNVCPWWSIHRDQPEQENGHCEYLGYGDWEVDGLSLLWDSCKECGVNNED